MTYVMSDIHGNLQAFESILDQIDLQPDDDLYILGDVIDRCPYGIEILRRIMAMPNAHMLLGNHEYMMLRAIGRPYDGSADIAGVDTSELVKLWYDNGGSVTYRAYRELSEEARLELVDYLLHLPLNYDIEVGGKLFKLVHAAPYEMYKLTDAPEHETRTHFCVWDRESIFYLEDMGFLTVIFGHTPTAMYQREHPLKIFYHSSVVGIDCGAGWSDDDKNGRLACLRLEDMQEFYSELPVDHTNTEIAIYSGGENTWMIK